MSQQALRREIRESGLLEKQLSPDDLRLLHAARQVIDPTGTLTPDARRGVQQPFRFRWYVAGALTTGIQGGRDMAPKAGTVTRVAAHVGTAPTTDNLIVELIDGPGNVLATVTVFVGQTNNEGAGQLAEINGGTWLGINVVQTGGAAGLSVVALEQAG